MCLARTKQAFCGCLRLEMQLTSQPIDACCLNPGFVKPTALMAGGLELTKRMWAACAAIVKSNKAEEEWVHFWRVAHPPFIVHFPLSFFLCHEATILLLCTVHTLLR